MVCKGIDDVLKEFNVLIDYWVLDMFNFECMWWLIDCVVDEKFDGIVVMIFDVCIFGCLICCVV